MALARKLERDGIPVLLTIQVDSVAKLGQNDSVIPANVGQAVNFYQPDGIVHGRPQIRAADPRPAEILGNFRYDYKTNPIRCEGYPWFDRVLHTEIECDPKVWSQVESLIYQKLFRHTRHRSAVKRRSALRGLRMPAAKRRENVAHGASRGSGTTPAEPNGQNIDLIHLRVGVACRVLLFRPFGAFRFPCLSPRLAPWATLFRRFAAGPNPTPTGESAGLCPRLMPCAAFFCSFRG